MTLRLFLTGLLITGVGFFNVEAQTNKSNEVMFASCETMIAGLGHAIVDFTRNAKPESFLVIIGGAVKGEKSSYNSRRIQEAIGYLGFAGSIKSDRITFGTGKPDTQAGYLRLYVNGMLSAEIRTRKSAQLCWGEGQAFDFAGRNKRN